MIHCVFILFCTSKRHTTTTRFCTTPHVHTTPRCSTSQHYTTMSYCILFYHVIQHITLHSTSADLTDHAPFFVMHHTTNPIHHHTSLLFLLFLLLLLHTTLPQPSIPPLPLYHRLRQCHRSALLKGIFKCNIHRIHTILH